MSVPSTSSGWVAIKLILAVPTVYDVGAGGQWNVRVGGGHGCSSLLS
ncbi:hypothetical protein [Mycobacterium sp.]